LQIFLCICGEVFCQNTVGSNPASDKIAAHYRCFGVDRTVSDTSGNNDNDIRMIQQINGGGIQTALQHERGLSVFNFTAENKYAVGFSGWRLCFGGEQHSSGKAAKQNEYGAETEEDSVFDQTVQGFVGFFYREKRFDTVGEKSGSKKGKGYGEHKKGNGTKAEKYRVIECGGGYKEGKCGQQYPKNSEKNFFHSRLRKR